MMRDVKMIADYVLAELEMSLMKDVLVKNIATVEASDCYGWEGRSICIVGHNKTVKAVFGNWYM